MIWGSVTAAARNEVERGGKVRGVSRAFFGERNVET
jgi:hypothetical protein